MVKSTLKTMIVSNTKTNKLIVLLFCHKLNPTQTVPTIVDHGFALRESRVIIQYLYNRANSELYPSDPKKRAIVDRMLQFDLGTLNSLRKKQAQKMKRRIKS